jgi:ribosomal protein S12 methylthiotransferase accessory factor
LTREEEVLIPFNWFYSLNEFNGSSAGNCVEEALMQGLCEIVERHVSSIVSRRRMKTPLIDLASIIDPAALQMIQKYAKAGVRLFITDFSLDTGIPSIGALAYDPTTFPGKSEIVWTAGTTPGPQKALIRALTEVAQLAGDFNTSSNYVASGLPKFKTLEDADYILRTDKVIPISALPDLSHDNIKVEIENCLAALSRRGMQVIVLDVTHPKLEIPAFYTIIPGAHFRERAAGTSLAMFSAKLIAENGNPTWAIQQLEKMDKILPGKYFIKFYLGSSHLALNHPPEALRCFEEALDLQPREEDIPSIYSYMGLCLKDLEHYREAISTFEKAEKYDRERTDVYNLMGYCHYKLREHEKAIQCFRRVLEIDPSSAIDYANIASNYRDMGDVERALRYYRLALELDPSIDFARDNLKRLEGGSLQSHAS